MNRVPENLISLPRLLADDAAVYRTVLSLLDQTQLQQDLNRLAEWHIASHPAKCTRLPVKRSDNVLKVKLPINRSENVLKVRYVLAFADRPPGTLAEDGRPWAILTLNTISTDQQSPL